jgi:hypothetical protein
LTLKKGGKVRKTKRRRGTKIMAVTERSDFPVTIYTDSASSHKVKRVGETLAEAFTSQLYSEAV